MRITGIPSQKNESDEDVRNSVKSVTGESGCNVPDITLDCAHTIDNKLSFCKICKATYCKIR